MSHYGYNDDFAMLQDVINRRAGAAPRRFDEYYRCYPIAMMPGPDRPSLNHGGKIFLPSSALDKLTRLHIAYPMLFELINGAAPGEPKVTHAGVLEFTAEEGRIYLPTWLMNTLLLNTGDHLQIKSTDLPAGSFIKLQAQSVDFLDISDPKAVLENAFRNFSCLTLGDVFSFDYNDTIYEVAVLEIKPTNSANAIYTMETDLEVDFAPPLGYVEPSTSATTKKSTAATGTAGKIHAQGTMAQRINYDSIAPGSNAVAAGHSAVAGHFASEGNRLGSKRSTKPSSAGTTGTSTPTTSAAPLPSLIKPLNGARNGPQPLRLPNGTLFFGFEYKPPPKRNADGKLVPKDEKSRPSFGGMGQTLRGKKIEAKQND